MSTFVTVRRTLNPQPAWAWTATLRAGNETEDITFAPSADAAMRRAWALWGGHLPAFVHVSEES